ncbi:MAG: hypothetical protein R2771_11315 [Saprospiraceae bacterium]
MVNQEDTGLQIMDTSSIFRNRTEQISDASVANAIKTTKDWFDGVNYQN